jgi:hypothetical protein
MRQLGMSQTQSNHAAAERSPEPKQHLSNMRWETEAKSQRDVFSTIGQLVAICIVIYKGRKQLRGPSAMPAGDEAGTNTQPVLM